jgi:hypothetical protein
MPKTVRRLSSITTLRGATPTSPEVANNFMNFRFNHLTQRPMPHPISCDKAHRQTNASGTAADHAGVGQAFGGGGMQGPRNDPGSVKVE